jgi:hypothetical protein
MGRILASERRAMNRKNVKQLVYRYNGVESSEEVEIDRDGEIRRLTKATLLSAKASVGRLCTSSPKFPAMARYPSSESFSQTSFRATLPFPNGAIFMGSHGYGNESQPLSNF